MDVTNLYAKRDFVPLNIKPGYWEYKSDMSADSFLKGKLANMPKAQQAMVRKMMEKQNKPVYQCITKDQIKDARKQFHNAKKKGKAFKDCKMVVKKSTKTIFVAEMKCPVKARSMKMETTVKNSKNIRTKVYLNVERGGPKTITSIGKWVSRNCPSRK